MPSHSRYWSVLVVLVAMLSIFGSPQSSTNSTIAIATPTDNGTAGVDDTVDPGNGTVAGGASNTAWQYLSTSPNYTVFTQLALMTSPLLVAYLNGTAPEEFIAPAVPGNSSVFRLRARQAAVGAAANAVDLTNGSSSATPYPLTVFAPTNAAFTNLPGPLQVVVGLLQSPNGTGLPDQVTNNADPVLHVLLANLLTYHVVNGTTFIAASDSLSNATSGQTGRLQSSLTPYPILINQQPGNLTSLRVNDANVTDPNVLVDNGVVHGISSVITPLYNYGLRTADLTQENIIGAVPLIHLYRVHL
ncbi:hypothetical protein RI367_001499 [Sorochytrium milnesiophthora]